MTKDKKFEVSWKEVVDMFEYAEFGPFEIDNLKKPTSVFTF